MTSLAQLQNIPSPQSNSAARTTRTEAANAGSNQFAREMDAQERPRETQATQQEQENPETKQTAKDEPAEATATDVKAAKPKSDEETSAETPAEEDTGVDAVLAQILGLPEPEQEKPTNEQTIALGLVTVSNDADGLSDAVDSFGDFLAHDSKSILSSLKALSTAPQMMTSEVAETLMTTEAAPTALANGAAPVVNIEMSSGALQPLPTAQQQAQPQVIATQRPDWVNNVSAAIAQAQDMGTEAMELTLTPENLGRVQIRIEMKDGVASVTIVTQNEDAAKLFNENQSKLSELMAHSGLDLAHHDAKSGSDKMFGGTGNGLSQSGNEPISDLTQEIAAPGMATSLVDLVA